MAILYKYMNHNSIKLFKKKKKGNWKKPQLFLVLNLN